MDRISAQPDLFGLSDEQQAAILTLEPTPFVDYDTMYEAMVEG